MKGYLMKMPVKGKKRSSLVGNLQSQMASWKRRYFLLRHGMLQWFRDDPGADGEVRARRRIICTHTRAPARPRT